jgi:hypothetical protein
VQFRVIDYKEDASTVEDDQMDRGLEAGGNAGN